MCLPINSLQEANELQDEIAARGDKMSDTKNEREYELIRLTFEYGNEFVIEPSHPDFEILESLTERGFMIKAQYTWLPINRYSCTQKARDLIGQGFDERLLEGGDG